MTTHLRVVKGAPDADELAAVTAVISTLLLGHAEEKCQGARRCAQWDRAFTPHPPAGSWRGSHPGRHPRG
ncbi:acyl-CoA carboxylase subunit epsilon [Streptomyces longwoodensis]|uniref:acyl-CoA carboxylase subunit epsilon n=1 Tax=Streptomyces longwoodensis TaxID=68231 RepID=UPI0033CB8982